jgi:hypothetical protein
LPFPEGLAKIEYLKGGPGQWKNYLSL